jgi:SAM-dependent methyltransferase
VRYYDRIRAGTQRSAKIVVPILVQLVEPRIVIDVGCGSGDWLRSFEHCGVTELTGVDGEWATPTEPAPFHFVSANLSERFSMPHSFDLAISLEVAEHLPASAALGFVDSLTSLAPIVLFSAAIPYQGGSEHLNEQWPEYWADLFADHDFVPVDCIRPQIWNVEEVDWWYVQNAILYVERAHLETHPALARAAERTDRTRLSVVHPRAYMRQVSALDHAYLRPDPERLTASALVSVAPKVMKNAVLRRLTRR